MLSRRTVRYSDPPGRSAAGPTPPDPARRPGFGRSQDPRGDISPLIRRLQAEFGTPRREGNSLRWTLPDALKQGRIVTVIATPIGSEGWMDVTVIFEAPFGTTSHGSTAIRPGASLDRFVQIIRQSVARSAAPPPPDLASEEEAS